MTGPKTNEGATKVGEHTGTRCVVKYVRSSASKARRVLDEIRGMDVQRADEFLQFAEVEIARTIRKALASAVANAENNDGQSRDELYVSACFADEGPTLKRFRPRARGRASRIHKRTCHITVIVSRMSDTQLEVRRRKEEASPAAARQRRGAANAAAARRERVAASRRAAAEARATEEQAADEQAADEPTTDEASAAGQAPTAVDAPAAEHEATDGGADAADDAPATDDAGSDKEKDA